MASVQQMLLASTAPAAVTYATWNPADIAAFALSNGNLTATANASGGSGVRATVSKSSGKWYFEAQLSTASAGFPSVGIASSAFGLTTGTLGQGVQSTGYRRDGNCYSDGSLVSGASSYTSGDVIGVAFDVDAKTAAFYKNGTLQATISWAFSAAVFPAVASTSSGGVWVANFGAAAFAHSPPSGYNAGVYQ